MSLRIYENWIDSDRQVKLRSLWQFPPQIRHDETSTVQPLLNKENCNCKLFCFLYCFEVHPRMCQCLHCILLHIVRSTNPFIGLVDGVISGCLFGHRSREYEFSYPVSSQLRLPSNFSDPIKVRKHPRSNGDGEVFIAYPHRDYA